jgi:hypothetical protein
MPSKISKKIAPRLTESSSLSHSNSWLQLGAARVTVLLQYRTGHGALRGFARLCYAACTSVYEFTVVIERDEVGPYLAVYPVAVEDAS